MDEEKRQQATQEDEFCYGLVGNIPTELRSADLRGFFSQFIESKGLSCFHYRHRPEVQKESKTDSTTVEKQQEKTCCCVIKVYSNKMDRFITMYNGQNWTNSSGKLLRHKVLISRIKIHKDSLVLSEQTENVYQTRQEQQHTARTIEEFMHSDLKTLPELHPPPVMPNGNVGTPLAVFIELIRTCKFPPQLIKKLGLTFPRSKRKKYGNVPFDYEILDKYGNIISGIDDVSVGKVMSSSSSTQRQENTVCNMSNNTQPAGITKRLLGNTKAGSSCTKTTKASCSDSKAANQNTTERNSDFEKNRNSDNSDDELEEWDRHACLHNDITSQERIKERLYEDNIELKWEKGGSGLVWYTDAAFWKQQEEADFDEETVDDWDVDMSIYDDEGAGDFDAKTLLQLRVEEEWKRGKNIDLNRVGSFEKYTRGFGGNFMRKHGWKAGQSLGSSQVGITEPLPNDGQHPSSKRGLGFYGEKLNRHVKRPRPTREAVISTIYDREECKNVELFQSEGPYNIKYRDKVDFVPQTTSE